MTETMIARFLLLIWEGFWIIGQGLGLDGRRLTVFADVLFYALAVLLGLWLASLVLIGMGVGR